jgi:hypothetical protein
MSLDLDILSPYFHVKLYVRPNGYDRSQHLSSLKSQMAAKNKSGRVYLKVLDEAQDSSLYAANILLKAAPTWLKNGGVAARQKVDPLEDVENVLLITYAKEETLFLHCTSEVVLELFESSSAVLPNMLTPISVTKMHVLAGQNGLVFRTLGITNVFGAGGTAPEAKAYYGRNARHSLSVTYDSGYGFSYFLGSRAEKNSVSAYGCSSKKRKVWGSWTKDIKDFRKKCDDIDATLKSGNQADTSPILVHPIEPPNPVQCKPWYFYMDYTAPRKGIVFLAAGNTGEYTSEWICNLEDDGTTIVFSIGAAGEKNVKVSLSRVSASTPEWHFQYQDHATASIKIHDETPEKDISKRHRKDLVDYLNNNEDFTIVLSRGLAYRERAYWSDNRLLSKFESLNSSVSWASTNIEAEFEKPKHSKRNTVASTVLDCLRTRFGPNAIIVQDHGADEVADYVVASPQHLVLVHIKASGAGKPGLRIQDLQIVVSQALKNMRYFIPEALLSRIDRLVEPSRIRSMPKGLGSTRVADQMKKFLSNYQIEKKLWLVQPGLSSSGLTAHPKNKAHALLNHLEGICISNNVSLEVVSSL